MSDSTRIYLVRHGGTVSSDANLFAGSSNPALSETGRSQVGALAARLASVEFSAAYCSDKDRAIETATIICRAHRSVHPIALPALREIDHGHWEGVEHKAVEEKFADEYRRWSDDPANFAPEGGETGAAVLARALPAINKIAADHRGQRVLVVSHTATNRLLLCALLGIYPSRYRDRWTQDVACLNILEMKRAGEAKAIVINDTSHWGRIK